MIDRARWRNEVADPALMGGPAHGAYGNSAIGGDLSWSAVPQLLDESGPVDERARIHLETESAHPPVDVVLCVAVTLGDLRHGEAGS